MSVRVRVRVRVRVGLGLGRVAHELAVDLGASRLVEGWGWG